MGASKEIPLTPTWRGVPQLADPSAGINADACPLVPASYESYVSPALTCSVEGSLSHLPQTMALELYTDPRLPCPQRVHLVVLELGLDVIVHRVSLKDGDNRVSLLFDTSFPKHILTLSL
jgi:hypothetical protein